MYMHDVRKLERKKKSKVGCVKILRICGVRICATKIYARDISARDIK